jgi:hypothetical protein
LLLLLLLLPLSDGKQHASGSMADATAATRALTLQRDALQWQLAQVRGRRLSSSFQYVLIVFNLRG